MRRTRQRTDGPASRPAHVVVSGSTHARIGAGREAACGGGTHGERQDGVGFSDRPHVDLAVRPAGDQHLAGLAAELRPGVVSHIGPRQRKKLLQCSPAGSSPRPRAPRTPVSWSPCRTSQAAPRSAVRPRCRFAARTSCSCAAQLLRSRQTAGPTLQTHLLCTVTLIPLLSP